MVKNTTGGSKHKNMARKNMVGGRAGRLRTANEDGEVYAVVTKILGGANCMVTGSDKTERRCIIRGKFRGGSGRRRDNTLRPGGLVLIGDRDWASSSDKPTCDLLEVYSDADKDKLKQSVTTIDWSFLNGVGEVSSSAVKETDNIEFSDNVIDEEYQELIKNEKDGEQNTIDFEHEGKIDIDDI